eukprot:TRINITY_DN8822_c0_g5_i1.p1 TRINITY_DN8822_c0_g5~~TRINITY_DN8822_c0_g5_i1.p1  ORF type:complete len:374 (-),score=45.82 TRINITY_DN8822_c0_g5_i1:554-1675(-)
MALMSRTHSRKWQRKEAEKEARSGDLDDEQATNMTNKEVKIQAKLERRLLEAAENEDLSSLPGANKKFEPAVKKPETAEDMRRRALSFASTATGGGSPTSSPMKRASSSPKHTPSFDLPNGAGKNKHETQAAPKPKAVTKSAVPKVEQQRASQTPKAEEKAIPPQLEPQPEPSKGSSRNRKRKNKTRDGDLAEVVPTAHLSNETKAVNGGSTKGGGKPGAQGIVEGKGKSNTAVANGATAKDSNAQGKTRSRNKDVKAATSDVSPTVQSTGVPINTSKGRGKAKGDPTRASTSDTNPSSPRGQGYNKSNSKGQNGKQQQGNGWSSVDGWNSGGGKSNGKRGGAGNDAVSSGGKGKPTSNRNKGGGGGGKGKRS